MPAIDISVKQIFTKRGWAWNSEYLFACSGGLDSMTLLQLLLDEGMRPSVAHMNFGLRGQDSEGDEAFVEHFCQENQLPFYCRKVHVAAEAQPGESIQMTARRLRYNWFKEILRDKNLQKVITAHHADDQAETLIINTLRGTGFKGMAAMHFDNGFVIRPLLENRRRELEALNKERSIPFRKDKSNDETDYQRNFIRHKIIPLFEEVNVKAVEHLVAATFYIQQAMPMLKRSLDAEASSFCPVPGTISYELRESPRAVILLQHLLEPFGLSAFSEDLLAEPGPSTGSKFYSSTHELLVDRQCWLIRERYILGDDAFYWNGEETLMWKRWTLEASLEDFDGHFPEGRYEILIPETAFRWPLLVRSWEEGDKMKPLGMKGVKKVSDIFTDDKVNRFEKDEIPVLVASGRICWLVGLRTSEEFKITGPGRVWRLKASQK